jgi:hypothetical protein
LDNKSDINDDKEKRLNEQHDLITDILKDPNSIVNISTFVGYLGKGSSEELLRLYLNTDFNEYIEVKKKDILTQRKVNDTIIPFGGTAIFVQGASKIRYVNVTVTDQPANFISGEISEKFLKPSIKSNNIRRSITNIETDKPLSSRIEHFLEDVEARPRETRNSRTCCTAAM